MEILQIDAHFDGGTIEITTDSCNYCFDKRLDSKTIGKLYLEYPKKDNSNIIEDYRIIENDIVMALDYFSPDICEEYLIEDIKKFIKSHN